MLVGLFDSKYENLIFFTEAIQGGMISLMDADKLTVVSGVAFLLPPEYAARVSENAASHRNRIVLRP